MHGSGNSPIRRFAASQNRRRRDSVSEVWSAVSVHVAVSGSKCSVPALWRRHNRRALGRLSNGHPDRNAAGPVDTVVNRQEGRLHSRSCPEGF